MLMLVLLLGCGPGPIDEDLDGDGASGAADCDDADATRHPGAQDVLGDAVDYDCDGLDGPDRDGDGFVDLVAGGDDCDDARADVHPDAEDAPYDGVDADCAGDSDADVDEDGYDATAAGGADCDDADPEINPDALEHCDGVDEDCDGDTDDSAVDDHFYYADADADGYGKGASVQACTAPAGYSDNNDDCDDADGTVHPGAVDACGDGLDQDCVADEPACGLWRDGDVDDAAAIFEGTVDDTAVGRFLGGGHDLTGDGAADVVVGVGATIDGETTVAIFAGPRPASGTVDGADARILQAEGPAGHGWLIHVAVATDLTGDLEPDIFVGSSSAGERSEGMAALYSGPFTGTIGTDEADVRVLPAESYDQLGGYFAAPGDLTGDGVDDFAVTTDDVYVETWVFAGPLTGSVGTDAATASFTSTARGDIGLGLGGGDVDGDGVADLIAGTGGNSLLLYLGPLQGALTQADADTLFLGESRDELGCNAQVSADQDGDGHVEIWVAACAMSLRSVYLFDGPFAAEHSPTSAEAEIVAEDNDDYLGYALTSGDFDGDGRADIVAGAFGNDAEYDDDDDGAVLLYYGPVSGRRQFVNADVTLRGAATEDRFGCGLSAADIDGDGLDDLLAGADCGAYDAEAPGFATLWYGGPGT